jgi:hypothetical protein
MKLTTTALIALSVQTALFSQAAPKVSLKVERLQGKGIRDHEVYVLLRVTNISQQTVEVLLSGVPERLYTFAVVGPDGRPAPPTIDAGKHRRTLAFSEVLYPLAPGETGTYGYYPLSDVVDFSRPGTYRITATHHFGVPPDETLSFDSATAAGLPATRHLGAPFDETDSSNVLEVRVP